MSRAELKFGPHGINVGGTEDDDGPSTGLDAVHYLVRDHLPHTPVPGVDQTAELVRGVLRLLQPRQQLTLHILRVLVGVG